jgi:YD repeat-containing protein
MAKILTKDVADGVTETFEYDETDHIVGVRRTQDVEPFLDHIARVNQEGVEEVEGLGLMSYDVPITVAIQWAQERGVPWEVLAFSKQYEDEWLRLCKSNPKFAYRPAKRLHSCR